MSTRTRLFRKEVVAAMQAEALGSARVQPPRSGWVFFGLSITVMLGVLAVLFCVDYTDYANFEGVLINKANAPQVELYVPSNTPDIPRTLAHAQIRMKAVSSQHTFTGTVEAIEISSVQPTRARQSGSFVANNSPYHIVVASLGETLSSADGEQEFTIGTRTPVIVRVAIRQHSLAYWLSEPLMGVTHEK